MSVSAGLWFWIVLWSTDLAVRLQVTVLDSIAFGKHWWYVEWIVILLSWRQTIELKSTRVWSFIRVNNILVSWWNSLRRWIDLSEAEIERLPQMFALLISCSFPCRFTLFVISPIIRAYSWRDEVGRIIELFVHFQLQCWMCFSINRSLWRLHTRIVRRIRILKLVDIQIQQTNVFTDGVFRQNWLSYVWFGWFKRLVQILFGLSIYFLPLFVLACVLLFCFIIVVFCLFLPDFFEF